MILTIIICSSIFIFYFIIVYNKLIFLKNVARTAWAGVDINLKLRNDLLPLLVSIIKDYSKYEKSTFKELTQLRVNLDKSSSVLKKALINEKINESMRKVFLVAEAYPKLMANKSFLKLQKDVVDLESNIAFKRQFYNDTVFKYNTFLMSFPSNFVGKFFGFKIKESFSDNSNYKGVKL
jgi:LemA protein